MSICCLWSWKCTPRHPIALPWTILWWIYIITEVYMNQQALRGGPTWYHMYGFLVTSLLLIPSISSPRSLRAPLPRGCSLASGRGSTTTWRTSWRMATRVQSLQTLQTLQLRKRQRRPWQPWARQPGAGFPVRFDDVWWCLMVDELFTSIQQSYKVVPARYKLVYKPHEL